MPTTPVGQIPYPQGADKPVISSDMKSLATVADTWTSSLDTAFQNRIGTITSRLNAVHTRVTGTNSNLATLSATMNAGDAAITSEQNSLTAVEARLAAQDTSAGALQTRYTNDLTELTHLETKTPKGVKALSTTGSSWSIGTIVASWITQRTINCDGPGAIYRVCFSTSFWDSDSGLNEIRISWGQGNSANWWNLVNKQLIGGVSYTMPMPMSVIGYATGMPAGTVTIGIATAGYNQPPSGLGQVLSIQQMTSA